MLHQVAERALEIELDSQTFRLVTPSDQLQGARILFGGSFNPPHLGHQALLKNLVHAFPEATPTLVPVHTHAFGKNLAPFESRYRWCQRLADSISTEIEVTDVESRLDGRSVSTAQYFSEAEPRRRLVWVIGSDLLKTLPSWSQSERLSELVEFCVFQRGGALTDDHLVASSVTFPEVSSTELRADLARGRVSESALPEVLKAYFLKENPYLDHR